MVCEPDKMSAYLVPLFPARELDHTSDPTRKYPNQKCGLCNQLFRVINALACLDPFTHTLILDLFLADYLEGTTLPISEILNLDAMSNLYGWSLRDVSKS